MRWIKELKKAVGRKEAAAEEEESLTEQSSVLGQIVPRKPIGRFLRQIRRHGYWRVDVDVDYQPIDPSIHQTDG